ncbi:redox-sensitive transcriptional activator SoxR [Motiliproteus sp. MSK22-1]|uniref:redox-sensitive transcriptional activator SoxR n=1 Tax=Motiliproteus sp. MSK22-1 TaxID=1897630 RepID=UPI00117BF206|nr:redox-sensitive transcriptional activator SoxR [Motiliproteus sp. MSK22-1]
MNEKKTELSVGEVSARSGVAVSAIHFYESKGLIKSWRNNGNHRRYGREVLRKIAVIKAAQNAGIPLKEIATALATIPDSNKVTSDDWEKLSTKWKSELDDRIERLIMLRDRLSYCIGCGCLSVKHCEMINPSDKLAEKGAGPRLLDPKDVAEFKKDWNESDPEDLSTD